jgi:hypothetical protein
MQYNKPNYIILLSCSVFRQSMWIDDDFVDWIESIDDDYEDWIELFW